VAGGLLGISGRAGLAAIAVGLALLAPVTVRSQAAVDWSKVTPLNVMMLDDKFVPDKLTFHHGVAYELHLENHGKEMHEFTAPEFFASSVVRDPRILANGGKDVVVQPGAAADVYVMPLKPGPYSLICADHDWDGMVGEITVE
jgi:uncharacterized cupredoxin-like copper-binding protein